MRYDNDPTGGEIIAGVVIIVVVALTLVGAFYVMRDLFSFVL